MGGATETAAPAVPVLPSPLVTASLLALIVRLRAWRAVPTAALLPSRQVGIPAVPPPRAYALTTHAAGAGCGPVWRRRRSV